MFNVTVWFNCDFLCVVVWFVICNVFVLACVCGCVSSPLMLCVNYCVVMYNVLCVFIVFSCVLNVFVWFVCDLLCGVVWSVCVGLLCVFCFVCLCVVLLKCAVECFVCDV